MYKRDTHWVYSAEDYEGMYLVSIGRRNTAALQDRFISFPVQLRSDRTVGTVRKKKWLRFKIAIHHSHRGVYFCKREGRYYGLRYEKDQRLLTMYSYT